MPFDLSQFTGTFLYAFTTLFPVVDPIGAGMLFLAMTMSAKRQERQILATRVAMYSVLMLFVSLWAGSFVLRFFGISVPVLRVAGGLVLAISGWRTLNQPDSSKNDDQDKVAFVGREQLIKKAFYPLTLPLTIGPGAIAVSTAIGSTLEPHVANILAVNLAALAICLCIFLSFRYSDRITARLGATGSDAIVRIFSFIMICIGLQILWTGIAELVVEVSKKV